MEKIKAYLSSLMQNKNVRFWGFQLFLAFLLIFGLIYIALLSLDSWTRHGEFVVVPDLTPKMSEKGEKVEKVLTLSEAQELLEKNHLRYEVIDSAAYDPNLPKYAVVSQTPEPNEKVKKDRKIYLTLNPANYRKITVPNVIQMPLSTAEDNLKSAKFQVGKITYVNNIGKDMVLQMFYKGKEVKPRTLDKDGKKVLYAGDKLLENSKIDIVCGNGFDASNPDATLPNGDTSNTEEGKDNRGIDF